MIILENEIRKLEMTYVKGFNRNTKEPTEIKDEKGNTVVNAFDKANQVSYSQIEE